MRQKKFFSMNFIPPLAPTPEAVFLLNAGGDSCYSKFMRLFLFAFAAAFLCAGVFGAQIGADESRIAAEVYVSSTHGDDANDGSRDKPFKTFAKIPKKDARIFLRKGDVFYEPLAGLENCVVDSYGRGSKKPLRGNLAARHGQNRKFRGAQSAGERSRQALQQHRRHIRHVHRRAARQGIEKAFRPQRRLGHDSLLRIPKREGDSRDFQVPAFEARAQSGGVRLARPHHLRQRHKRP